MEAQRVLSEILAIENNDLPKLSIGNTGIPAPRSSPDAMRVLTDSEICESETDSLHAVISGGISDVTYNLIHKVEVALYKINTRIGSIGIGVRKLGDRFGERRMASNDLGGIRDDWTVKKRRIISRNRHEWVEGDLVDLDYSTVDYLVGRDSNDFAELTDVDAAIQPVYGNNDREYGHSISEQHVMPIADITELTPPQTIQKPVVRSDDLPSQPDRSPTVHQLFDNVFGNSEGEISFTNGPNRIGSSSPVYSIKKRCGKF